MDVYEVHDIKRGAMARMICNCLVTLSHGLSPKCEIGSAKGVKLIFLSHIGPFVFEYDDDDDKE